MKEKAEENDDDDTARTTHLFGDIYRNRSLTLEAWVFT